MGEPMGTGPAAAAIVNQSEDPRDVLAEQWGHYWDHPDDFCADHLNLRLDDYQTEVAYSLVENDFVSARSGHGVGKSTLAAGVFLWFLNTRPKSKVVTTAPTRRQLREILWSEIHRWGNPSSIAHFWQFTALKVFRDDPLVASHWYGLGQTSSSPSNMEGFHAEFLLYIVDEAKGVPDAIFEGLEGALTTEAKILLVSTPGSPSGKFYRTHTTERHLWKTHHRSAIDSPRVRREWIDYMINTYGDDNPVVVSRVFGDFPAEGEYTLIPISWVEHASSLDHFDLQAGEPEGFVIGFDVARYGGDSSVMVPRKGPNVYPLTSFTNRDTMQLAGALKSEMSSRNATSVVDDAGAGGGVVDRLQEQGMDCIGVNASQRASEPARFANARAEMYWNLRERLRLTYQECRGETLETGPYISLPYDDDLHAQLCAPNYLINSSDQIQIESKEEIKKKLRGKSPDKADALALAFYTDKLLLDRSEFFFFEA